MPRQALEEILKHYPAEKDQKLIREAFEFACSAHQGQKRFSGEPYIIHPARAALILAHLKLDSQTIAAAFLHDVLDDTGVSPQQLEDKFGKEISFLVRGVSLLGKLRLPRQKFEIEPIEKRGQKPASLEIENLRRMFFAMAEDVRVILIKLADRVHNMETIEFMPKEKQKRFALETMEVFAPLANRLGIKTIKTKLENLAFPYLYPKEYQWLRDNVRERHEESRRHLERARMSLKKHLEEEGIGFIAGGTPGISAAIEIQARLKSYFSLYQKLLRKEMNFDQIYDLAAIRLIVKDVKTCYEALGVIHKYWRPLPGRIKDYIAFPRPNGYQSLHTTVFCEEGKIIEVQIRTQEMNETAEHGICAHWARKEGVDLKRQGEQFAWIKELAGWQKEKLNSQEYLEGLKIDFFKNRIFIFTPQGDIIDLPEGACAVDFAYAVHSEVGNQCSGSKINGKMVPVSTSLKNGDVVEILLDKNKKPSHDWLKFVKTGFAKSHIKKQTEVSILKNLRGLRERFFPGKPAAKPAEKETAAARSKAAPTSAVLIGGKSGVAFALAKCCQPKSPDTVVAYLTKTRGATVHLQNCQNLKRLRGKFPEKVLEAKWR